MCARRGRKAVGLFAAAALLAAEVVLSGCSTNIGELPFPAVHDTPPPRASPTLSDAEQKKAAQELLTARDTVTARVQQNAAQSTAQAGGQPVATGSTNSTAAQAGGARSQ
jgi:hypothetical protein